MAWAVAEVAVAAGEALAVKDWAWAAGGVTWAVVAAGEALADEEPGELAWGMGGLVV